MSNKQNILFCTTILAVSAIAFTGTASAQDSTGGAFIDTIKNGKVMFDARYRFEHVDDSAFINDADASTLRTRLGYETTKFYGLSGLLEFSNTTVLGSEDFNDTLNGRATYAVVPDPEGTALNRAFLQYHNIPDTIVTVGRQTLTLDNERFVTNGNFRQKQKTFDQAHIVTNAVPHITAQYAYMWKTHDNTSSDSDAGNFSTNNHLINISTDIIPHVRVAGYGYLLDFDRVAANSLNTYGIHLDGSYPVNDQFSFLYQGDWATQSDAADNTANIDFNYFLIEPGIQYNGFTVKAGYQHLEGNGTNAFQTPMAMHTPIAAGQMYLAQHLPMA